MEQILLFVISLVANIFSAFSGGGAGLLQLPALIFLGLPFSIALATHKTASVALGIGATIRHLREEALDRRIVVYILFSGIPGVILGASLVLALDDRVAEIALGIMTIGLGVYSISKPSLGQAALAMHRDRQGLIIGAIGLFVIGILNGSLTSGTGLFVTLWLVRWFGFEYKIAVTYTLILVGMAWNGSGAITLGYLGEIRWDWMPALLLGSLLGGFIGAHLAIKSGSYWIKKAFEVITLLVGFKLILP